MWIFLQCNFVLFPHWWCMSICYDVCGWHASSFIFSTNHHHPQTHTFHKIVKTLSIKTKWAPLIQVKEQFMEDQLPHPLPCDWCLVGVIFYCLQEIQPNDSASFLVYKRRKNWYLIHQQEEQKSILLIWNYLVFLVFNRPLCHKEGSLLSKLVQMYTSGKNWLVSQIMSRAFDIPNLLSVYVDTVGFGLELLLLRCYTKTPTKQIKSHVLSLVSAHLFEELSLRPIREQT